MSILSIERRTLEWLMSNVLAALSLHGYRLVPAEATEEMAKTGVKTEPFCSFSMINAATEAGDVLRGAK